MWRQRHSPYPISEAVPGRLGLLIKPGAFYTVGASQTSGVAHLLAISVDNYRITDAYRGWVDVFAMSLMQYIGSDIARELWGSDIARELCRQHGWR